MQLRYERPFAWQEMLAYYRDRAVAGVELVNGTYTRSLRIDRSAGIARIRCDPAADSIVVDLSLPARADPVATERRLGELLDLGAVPQAVAAQLGRDPFLAPLVTAYPGLRVPGCWSVFEAAVRAIVGQQVSVKAARTVLGRLVREHGDGVGDADANRGPSRLFPEPDAIADRDLTRLGLNRGRANALAAIARRFADDPEFLHVGMPPDEAYARLLDVRGIGPWTANYVMLRGLRDLDAFPAADLGALKATGARNAAELTARAEQWRPWRGYALLYLWKSLAVNRA